MTLSLDVRSQSWPIAGSFTIARGARTHAHVVVATLRDGAYTGQGECVPYTRYGETVDGVMADIESISPQLKRGLDRAGLQTVLPAGAARNALDCAFWDLEAKRSGVSAARIAGLDHLLPVETAFTISLGSPEKMAEDTVKAAHRPLLKVKLGADGDRERIQAVRAAAPDARLIVDANEGWLAGNLESNMAACVDAGVELIEQPLPADADDILAELERPIAVCADESLHTAADLERLAARYDAVNVKLDKAGGLTEALTLVRAARERGFTVMIGCMLGTSLAMAPAIVAAQNVDYVDLDAPLLLAQDRSPGLVFNGSVLNPPPPALWG